MTAAASSLPTVSVGASCPEPNAGQRAGDTPETFRRFYAFITQQLGIKMSEAKEPMLRGRLNRRLRALRLDSIKAYQEFLFHSPEAAAEMPHFLDAVTTNKTDFFREPQHFEHLVHTALPALDPDASQSAMARPWRLKLWCAGCSSGEEPYTLAMVLSEYAANRPGFDFQILATDINTRVLDQARLGIYPEERIEPVPPKLRSRYLLRSRDPQQPRVRLVPAVRERLTFQRLNFMDADYGVKDQFEVIFFRNVMIYFDKPTQEAVIRKLCRNLIPGGYLFVGHSESLAGLDLPVVGEAMAVYRKPA